MGRSIFAHIEQQLGWLRGTSSTVARTNPHTDTDELSSSAIRRLATLDRDQGIGSRDVGTVEFRRYAHRVLINTGYDHARQAIRRREVSIDHRPARSMADRPLSHRQGRLVNSILNGEACTGLDLDMFELVQMIRQAESKDLLILRLMINGRSSRQIGDDLGMPATTVRSRVSALRNRLQRRMGTR